MPAAALPTRAEAARSFYVCDPRSVLAQALAGSEMIAVEPETRQSLDVLPGALLRVGSAVVWFSTVAAAMGVWRAVLDARRTEGRVVTEAEVGDEPEAFRARHLDALVAAGRVAP